MTTPSPPLAFPYRFVIGTFLIAGAIGAAVAYYGITGQLGWGIP